MEKLPTYEITIDEEYSEGEDLGIEQIAFTSNPAIVVKGMAFNSTVKPMFFKDEVKMRIAAPAMIPMNIYRRDEDGFEFEVKFTETEIEKIYSKFMANLSNSNVFNLEHDAKETVPAYVLEANLLDSDAKVDMIKQEYGIDVPKGSVFVVSQVTDKDYYNKLVENEQIGYSIEGFLGMKLSEIIKTKNKMSKQKYEVKLPDGEHIIGDKVYVVKDGVVIEEKPLEVTMEEEKKEEEVALEEEPKKEEEVALEEAPAEAGKPLTIEYVDNKFNELFELIADLKAELMDAKEEVAMEDDKEKVEMSASQIKMSKITSLKEMINKK